MRFTALLHHVHIDLLRSCGQNHTAGHFMVLRKTIGKRMAAKLKEIRQKLRRGLHEKTLMCALRENTSEVRTVCVRIAGTDLCGGCRVTGIPTATLPIVLQSGPSRDRKGAV